MSKSYSSLQAVTTLEINFTNGIFLASLSGFSSANTQLNFSRELVSLCTGHNGKWKVRLHVYF